VGKASKRTSKGREASPAAAPGSSGKPLRSATVGRAAARAASWSEEELRAQGEELEGETAEEAEELELEELNDEEVAELPAKTPVPEEEETEW